MKKIRLINEKAFSSVCSVLAGLQAIFLLCDLLCKKFIYNEVDLLTIINTGLSVLFYILICNNLFKAKENFAYARNAVGTLLLADYVLPVILNFTYIISLLMGAFNFLSILTLVPLAAGVLYFINFFIYFRTQKSKCLKWMIVTGIILFALGLVSCGYDIYTLIVEIKVISQIQAGTVSGLLNVLYCLIAGLLTLSSFSLSTFYIWYALVIKKGY